MRLVRELGKFPQMHVGPRPDGTFWAAAEANDLPGRNVQVTVDLDALLLRGARIWVQNASHPDTWQDVHSASDLPEFRTVDRDDYNACRYEQVFRPYLPEFYVLADLYVAVWAGRDVIGYMPLARDLNHLQDDRIILEVLVASRYTPAPDFDDWRDILDRVVAAVEADTAERKREAYARPPDAPVVGIDEKDPFCAAMRGRV